LAVEKWERDEINRQFAALERAQQTLEEKNRKTEQRLWELDWRDGMRVHLSYAVVSWGILAGFVAFEIVTITLRVSAS
jgi:hypothetical protein